MERPLLKRRLRRKSKEMPYHFKYTITLEEYEEYSVFTSWEAPWQKKVKLKFIINNTLFSALVMTATYIVLEKIGPSKKNHYPVLIIFFIFFLLVAVLLNYSNVPYRIKNKARKFIEKEDNQKLLAERELELTDKQIIISNQELKSYEKWESITKYAVSKNHFFLYVNSESAHLIPKRFFSSQQEINEFDKFLSQKVSISSSFRSLGI